MTPSARITAAIEIIDSLETKRRPLSDALREWGQMNRYAGSKDRHAISSLVYDSLRVKFSASALMQNETGRGAVLGMLALKGFDFESLDFEGKYAPKPLTGQEKSLISKGLPELEPHISADCPSWIFPYFKCDLAEIKALNTRADLDVRVNTLKTTRAAVLEKLALFNPVASHYSENGIRFHEDAEGRLPPVSQEVAFLQGEYEVQDEGSQLISELAGAKSGEIVIDLCAGGGGKALAMAALMGNKGKIFATDIDRRRLAPLAIRAERAGATIIELLPPVSREDEPLKGIEADLVVIDAPCSGTGTWRRNPDAKIRIREGALEERLKDQGLVLDRAARFVKKGGRIAYMTCSMLEIENDGQIADFLANFGFEVIKLNPSFPHIKTRYGVQLTPLQTGTDGFYIAVLKRV